MVTFFWGRRRNYCLIGRIDTEPIINKELRVLRSTAVLFFSLKISEEICVQATITWLQRQVLAHINQCKRYAATVNAWRKTHSSTSPHPEVLHLCSGQCDNRVQPRAPGLQLDFRPCMNLGFHWTEKRLIFWLLFWGLIAFLAGDFRGISNTAYCSIGSLDTWRMGCHLQWRKFSE